MGNTHIIDIHEKYAIQTGYIRYIMIYNREKRFYEKDEMQTFICSENTSVKMREAYYDLLKDQFICRIKV